MAIGTVRGVTNRLANRHTRNLQVGHPVGHLGGTSRRGLNKALSLFSDVGRSPQCSTNRAGISGRSGSGFSATLSVGWFVSRLPPCCVNRDIVASSDGFSSLEFGSVGPVRSSPSWLEGSPSKWGAGRNIPSCRDDPSSPRCSCVAQVSSHPPRHVGNRPSAARNKEVSEPVTFGVGQPTALGRQTFRQSGKAGQRSLKGFPPEVTAAPTSGA